MAQQFRVYAAFAEELSLTPSTHMRWLTTAYNYSPGESDVSDLWGQLHSGAHTYTETIHTYT